MSELVITKLADDSSLLNYSIRALFHSKFAFKS